MKPNDTDPVQTPDEAVAPEAVEAGTEAELFAAESIAVLEAENAELKDKLLRSLAELENLRRRAARDVADARTYAVTNFARDMLTVADNTRRALDTIPADAVAALEDGVLKSFIEGIEVTERDLLNSLERHGVRKLDPKGERFDPHLHQAVFEIPNPEVPSGIVLEVMQTGYTIGERVLRPAMVGVSKGGPKAPPPQATDTTEQPNGKTEA